MPPSFTFPDDERLVPRYSEITDGPQQRIYQRALWDSIPLPLFGNTLTGTGLGDDGGFLILLNPIGYPTTPVGLSPGAVWSNAGFVCVVLPTTPNPAAPPVLFGSTTSLQLLLLGGGNLPIAPNVTNQLWNVAGFVGISNTTTLGLLNDGGVLTVTQAGIFPTSNVGLLPGALYSNGGVVSVVPGFSPHPGPPVYYGAISATALQALGSYQMPVVQPTAGSLQIWNAGGELWVA